MDNNKERRRKGGDTGSDRADRYFRRHQRKMEELKEKYKDQIEPDKQCPKCGTKGHLVLVDEIYLCLKTGTKWHPDDIEDFTKLRLH